MSHEECGGVGAADTTTTGFTIVVALRYCALTVRGATEPFTICVSTILCVSVCVCNKCAPGCDITSGVRPLTTTLPSAVVETGVGDIIPFSLVILVASTDVVTPLVCTGVCKTRSPLLVDNNCKAAGPTTNPLLPTTCEIGRCIWAGCTNVLSPFVTPLSTVCPFCVGSAGASVVNVSVLGLAP